jgi:hypothetical protein
MEPDNHTHEGALEGRQEGTQEGTQEGPPPNAVSETPSIEKETEAGVPTDGHVEVVRTISRVPGNPHYYEKDGLRTYGDDEDHDHEAPVRPALAATDRNSMLIRIVADEHSQIDVTNCHGFLVDRITNPIIFVRCV